MDKNYYKKYARHVRVVQKEEEGSKTIDIVANVPKEWTTEQVQTFYDVLREPFEVDKDGR